MAVHKALRGSLRGNKEAERRGREDLENGDTLFKSHIERL